MHGRRASIVGLAMALAAGGCSDGTDDTPATTGVESSTTAPDSGSPTTPAEATTAAPASTVPPPTSRTTAPAGEITIRATVATTFASARVIALVEPVSGIGEVAFTTDTRFVRADGRAAALGDLTTGTSVEVKGQRGTGDTLLARQIVIL